MQLQEVNFNLLKRSQENICQGSQGNGYNQYCSAWAQAWHHFNSQITVNVHPGMKQAQVIGSLGNWIKFPALALTLPNPSHCKAMRSEAANETCVCLCGCVSFSVSLPVSNKSPKMIVCFHNYK